LGVLWVVLFLFGLAVRPSNDKHIGCSPFFYPAGAFAQCSHPHRVRSSESWVAGLAALPAFSPPPCYVSYSNPFLRISFCAFSPSVVQNVFPFPLVLKQLTVPPHERGLKSLRFSRLLALRMASLSPCVPPGSLRKRTRDPPFFVLTSFFFCFRSAAGRWSTPTGACLARQSNLHGVPRPFLTGSPWCLLSRHPPCFPPWPGRVNSELGTCIYL